jgi:excinuclease ABC subunit C
MISAHFQEIAPTLPTSPGIYKYYDEKNILLYVGKAKNIRKRVSSYFSKTFTTYKTHELVQRIHHIEFTIVQSEQDAFLLENLLIKKFQPWFNINLKDDKTYPYIVIKKEPFPRVFLTRRYINDGSTYLGPFTSVKKVIELLQFIKQNIPLRNCKLLLSDQNINKKKFTVCLEYHLGNCKGPCAGYQNQEDYENGISQVRDFLKGNLFPVIQHFKKELKQLVADLQFEKASIIKSKIEHLYAYQAKSTIINPTLGDLDVCTVSFFEEKAYINFLMVRNGAIVNTKSQCIERKLDEPAEELLMFAIVHFRELFNSEAPEIIVPVAVTFPNANIKITVPKSGEKKKLIELSEKNVNYFIEEDRKKQTLHLSSPDRDMTEVLLQLQDDLSLQSLPIHIECFDNSNFQGSYPVSAMVCFKEGKPSKKDYRHYNVKTVEGINDFATMKEVVHRRYKQLVEENQSLPQLVIIDGGKGQLHAALDAIESLGISGQMTVVGLAKNVEEIFFAGDSESLKLPYDSESLQLVRLIRDSVHRFGVTFHRKKRAKGTFKNELDSVKGIGKSSIDALLKKFKSIQNIKAANIEDIISIIGKARADVLLKHFQQETPAAE